MSPYSALNEVLWNRWQELLPNSPGYMAEKIIKDLGERGWVMVKTSQVVEHHPACRKEAKRIDGHSYMELSWTCVKDCEKTNGNL